MPGQSVLAAAWELVREDGLAALSLRELARRAGITTPTVYAYFESKNAIFDAMFADAAREFVDLKAALPVTDDPRQDLLTEARAFVEFCVSDVPRYQLLFQHSVPGFTPSPESYELAVRPSRSLASSSHATACTIRGTSTSGPP